MKEDVKKQYALYLVSQENPEIYMEAMEFYCFNSAVFNDTGSYINGSMTKGLEDIWDYALEISKDVRAQLCLDYGNDMKNKMAFGYNLLNESDSLRQFPEDKAKKIKADFKKAGRESLGAYLQSYDCLILNEN